MFRKDHAWSRRHRARKSRLARENEFAGASGARIADGIGEVLNLAPYLALDDRLTLEDFMARETVGVLGEHRMGQRMRADRRERMLAEFAQSAPVETELVDEVYALDASLVGERAGNAEKLSLLASPQGPVERLEGSLLLFRCPGRQIEQPARCLDPHRRQRRDRLLHFHPPHARGAIRETRGDEDSEGRAVLFEDRQGDMGRVAIAVVERQRNERRGVACPVANPRDRLVQRDDRETLALQAGQ